MKGKGFLSYFLKYATSFSVGAFLLSAFSLIQKQMLGLPFSLNPKAFLIPIVFGGVSGLMISIFYTRLRTSQERLQDFINNVADIIQIVDAQGNFLFVNNAWYKTFGYPSAEVKELTVFDLIHPDHLTECQIIFQEIFTNKVEFKKVSTVFRTKDGKAVYLDGNITSRIENGKVISTRSIFRNVTEKQKAEEFQRLTSNVFENVNEGIMIINQQLKPTFVNAAFTRLSGHSKRDAFESNIHRLFPMAEECKDVQKIMPRELREKGYWNGEYTSKKRSGEKYTISVSINAIPNEQGEIKNYAGIFSDITERKEGEKNLYQLAMYDSLTNLPNREMFYENAKIAMEEAKENNTTLAILFLDLDNFKEINDQYGHDTGDRLLEILAQRLNNQVRKKDTIARFGGDEFIILITNIESGKDAKKIAEQILEAISEPYKLVEYTVNITASIGITLYSINDDINVLLKYADQAMYKAKKDGKNRVRINMTRETQPTLMDVLRQPPHRP